MRAHIAKSHGCRTNGYQVRAVVLLMLCFTIAVSLLLPPVAVFAAMSPKNISGHSNQVHSVAFSPDGRNLASGSFDNAIKIWNPGSGACLRTLSGRSGSVYSVAFSPDGRSLASGSYDKTIKVWDLESGACLRTLSGHSSSVYSVAFSPDGRRLASGGYDKTIKIWELGSGACLRTLGGHTSFVFSVAFSPDGRTLASGGNDNTIRIWDLESGACLRTLSGHGSFVYSVAFSPDGRSLASGGEDNTIKIWDPGSGACLRRLCGHNNSVYSVAFSPDGRSLASGGNDNTIRIWDLSSGACLRTLSGHGSSVYSLAFSPDGRSLASGSVDNSIKIWPIWQDEILCKYVPEVKPSSGTDKQSDSGTSSSNRLIRDKWALVIGISKFANPQYNLKYAAKDAQDFYNYLITDGHFKKDHVLLLLNENATRRNIMTSFGDKFLPAVTREGDLVTIYVSTHGTPANKDPGKKNYIVAYDTEADALYETGVNMDELYQRVKDGVRTDRALIVMDTCYSGGGVPGARGMDEFGNFDVAQIAQGFGHLVMSSSSPSERSWESKVSANGVFTKYLLQDLKLTGGNVKLAFNKLKDDVGWEVQNAFNQAQHPQLGGEWEGKELILSAPATAPRQILNPDLIKLINLSSSTSAKSGVRP